MIVGFTLVILSMRHARVTGGCAHSQDRCSPPRMHTTHRPLSSPRSVVAGVVLCLLGWMAAAAPPVAAQPAFPGVPDDGPSFNVRVYPSDLWTPRVGPGVGIGVVGHGLARPYDQWLITAAPALREQVATASFASANPLRAARYVLVDARALHTDADWFGPSDRRTVLGRSTLRMRVRGGQHLLNHRLLLQPHVALVHHRVDAVDAPSGGPPLAGLPLSPRQQTGLQVGADVRFDTRDQPQVPTRGLLLQGTWDRYVPLGPSDLLFEQVDLDAYGYVPLGGVHRLALRTALTLTEPRADAPIPVYMLPTVGGAVVPGWARGRFVGRDRLLASALYRFPLLHYEGLATIGGHVGMHVAGIYDRLADQFVADVSFDDVEALSPSARPLRPSASAGLRVAMPQRDHVSLELAVGVSPEGVSAVRFSFERRLQALRPPHHASENLR